MFVQLGACRLVSTSNGARHWCAAHRKFKGPAVLWNPCSEAPDGQPGPWGHGTTPASSAKAARRHSPSPYDWRPSCSFWDRKVKGPIVLKSSISEADHGVS